MLAVRCFLFLHSGARTLANVLHFHPLLFLILHPRAFSLERSFRRVVSSRSRFRYLACSDRPTGPPVGIVGPSARASHFKVRCRGAFCWDLRWCRRAQAWPVRSLRRVAPVVHLVECGWVALAAERRFADDATNGDARGNQTCV